MRQAAALDRRFYTGMAVLAAASVFIGFAPTYYLRPRFEPTPLPSILHVHGAVFSAWILLFVVQAGLVAAGRTDLHRRLGWLGAGLAGTVGILGVVTAVVTGRIAIGRGFEADVLPFFTTPLSSMALFLTLAGAGIRVRRHADAHKRLMLLATLSILDAAFARWPFEILATSSWAGYVLTDVPIALAIAYDVWTRGRVHRTYVWGGLLIVLVQTLRIPIGETQVWQDLARWVLIG